MHGIGYADERDFVQAEQGVDAGDGHFTHVEFVVGFLEQIAFTYSP